MGFVSEFKDFALKGNVFDMAVGVIIGGAFGKLTGSLIDNVLNPIIGKVVGGVDFSNWYIPLSDAVAEVKDATGKVITAAQPAVSIKIGSFIGDIVNFIILAFVVFLMVKAFNTAKKRFEAEKPAAAPAGPTTDQKLLMEIRDLLAKR